MTEHLVLGLDIGGTHTRARLVRGDQVLGEAKTASASLTAAGRERAAAALQDVVDQLQLAPAGLDAVCVGTAGSGTPAARSFLVERLGPLTRSGEVVIVNDVRLVLATADLAEGVAVVAGTGSNCVGVVAGRESTAGGWGYLLGDEGSGYWVVREAVRELLRRADRDLPAAALGADLLAAVDCADTRALLERFYEAPAPGTWARHARDVLDCADPFAQVVLAAAARALARLVDTCADRLDGPPDLPVALAGGLLAGHDGLAAATTAELGRLRPRAPVVRVTDEPIVGAIRLAAAAS